jgi:hypothetical protein
MLKLLTQFTERERERVKNYSEFLYLLQTQIRSIWEFLFI